MTEKVDSAKPTATTSVAVAAKPATAKKPEAVKPLYALHKIVYGKAQVAVGNSIFAPTSEKEREDILKLGAARELNDVEAVIAKSMKFATADADGEDFQ